ncbi:putative Membrane protein [Parafrankia sp. Ea1.12]|uniref:hypothetical protein n=1 Tax=Parafrankia sp. Ea1.12 TaxID=573499 RepID=UPI000DA52D35|nr:hypothetical protein [Parafrankia sp. Ea1.12]SQD98131.1 putative Membrane protein [Parafrankia sp. Ea1.12]
MTLTADAHDLGRLLWWAARPRETPARNEDYHRIVGRYRREPDFALAADAMFTGAGLRVVVDERDGVIVIAESNSPLRLTLGDLMKRAQPHHRAVIGAVVLGIARAAYPEPSMVDDPDRIPLITAQNVVDILDRVAQAHADTRGDDSDLDDDRVEMWRRWTDLAPARPNARRQSMNDRRGVVNRVCRLIAEAGYLTARGETDGGTWTVRPRFRHTVATLTTDSDLYALVNGLADRSAQEAGTSGEPADASESSDPDDRDGR